MDELVFKPEGRDAFDDERLEEILEQFNKIGCTSFFVEYDHETKSWVPWRGGRGRGRKWLISN